MSEETKTQFKTEGQPAFPVENKENDNSSSSSEGEETNTNQTGSSDQDNNQTKKEDDSDDNFADHPRWQEREKDWKSRFNEQEQRHLGDITKLRTEFEQKFTDIGKVKPNIGDTSVQVPAWFGGDDNQWQEFLNWNNSLVGKAKEEARTEVLKEIETKSTTEQKSIDDATKYFNEQLTSIEADKTVNPQGEKIDRNKLLKFVLDNELVDTKGRWNYRAGFMMMKAGVASAKNDTTKERKQIASAITSENRAETKSPAFMTSADFSKPGARPW